MDTKKICYKCLLEDLDEGKILKTVKEMIDAIPEDKRTDLEEYRRRLEICKMRLLCRTESRREKQDMPEYKGYVASIKT